jgi:hypothetical protein
VFLPPHNIDFELSSVQRHQISVHIGTRYSEEARPGKPAFRISGPALLRLVPHRVERWGKFSIANDGDTIHAYESVKRSDDGRDATYIRVSYIITTLQWTIQMHFYCKQFRQLVDKMAHRPRAPPQFEEEVLYGHLLNIFVINLTPTPILRLNRPVTHILVQVKPCPISKGPIPNTTSYLPGAHESTTPYVIDLSVVSAVVGRFEHKGRVYIIDRTDGSVDPSIPDA